MFIPNKILTLFLSVSAVVGAASSDVHTPIALNTDEDVSSPNLRSLAIASGPRELARKKPFDEDDELFDLPLSLEWTIPKNTDVEQLKNSLVNLFNLVVKDYDKDGVKVLDFALVNEDGDGRELASVGTITIKFALKTLFRRQLYDCFQRFDIKLPCYCAAASDILALLNLYAEALVPFAQ